jgi:hypothetical protein
MNDLNLYQTQLENLNRRNDLAQSLSNFQLARGQSIAGALQGYGNAKYADQAARTDAIMNTSQGAGRAVGGVLDIAGGAGGLGSGVQGLYQQQPYWRQQRRPY